MSKRGPSSDLIEAINEMIKQFEKRSGEKIEKVNIHYNKQELVLFPLPEPPDPEPVKNRCRKCKHMYAHYYNGSMKYCRWKFDVRTAYGHKKIKANDPACELFEEKLKQ
jgi:hypothetical protein